MYATMKATPYLKKAAGTEPQPQKLPIGLSKPRAGLDSGLVSHSVGRLISKAAICRSVHPPSKKISRLKARQRLHITDEGSRDSSTPEQMQVEHVIFSLP